MEQQGIALLERSGVPAADVVVTSAATFATSVKAMK